ncbi:hypothetical protein ACHQM5_013216 [Ranunculus cassubicifolius]
MVRSFPVKRGVFDDHFYARKGDWLYATNYIAGVFSRWRASLSPFFFLFSFSHFSHPNLASVLVLMIGSRENKFFVALVSHGLLLWAWVLGRPAFCGLAICFDHWRKNIPVLAKSHRVYAIDLIGYGYSDKPNPNEFGANSFYTFETWAAQLNDFCVDVVKGEAFFICNSIGGLVGLQAAIMNSPLCKGILLINISLRMLHITKQPWFGRPFIRSFQNLLRDTSLGKFFFKSVATPQSVKSILCQCYHDTTQVTDELVEKILLPGLEPGAVDVFLAFICYSDGPLPEELLPQVKCPVLIAWGDKDPWEPIELGKAYGEFSSVEEFVVLPNVGHCPQDEAPQLVNPLVEKFVARHTSRSDNGSLTTV